MQAGPLATLEFFLAEGARFADDPRVNRRMWSSQVRFDEAQRTDFASNLSVRFLTA